MNLATIINRGHNLKNVLRLNVRLFASIEEVKPEDTEKDEITVPDVDYSEDAIEVLRNKSHLTPNIYRKFHKQARPLSEDEKVAYSLSRLRRLYGKYGSSSGVNVGLLWPSKEEMELQRELEEITYPDNIHRMIELAKQSEEDEKLKLCERQQYLAAKMAKLEDWKQEVRDRIAEKERLAREGKEKKERMIEEVRQIFGFRIDPKDERFKEALEKKEKEEKKAAKAAKKLKRQQKMAESISKRVQLEQSKTEHGESSIDSQSADTAPSTKTEGSVDLQNADAAPSTKTEGSVDLQNADAAPSTMTEGSVDLQNADAALSTMTEGSVDLQNADAAPSTKTEGSVDLQNADAAPSAKTEGSGDVENADAPPSTKA